MATSGYQGYDLKSIRKYWNNKGLKQQKDGICFCWNSRFKDFTWLNSKDVKTQFKQFKKQRCYISESNNRKYTDKKGGVWYGLTIQINDEMSIDVGAMAISGLMVSGCVYWFCSEKNRDAMVGYINKVDLAKFMKL